LVAFISNLSLANGYLFKLFFVAENNVV